MTINKELLAGLILVVTFSAANGQTGLLLSGDTVGVFRPVTGSSAAAANSPDRWGSSFRIGVPMNHSFQSGVSFNGHDFVDLQDGDLFSPGLITYYNGINRLGTSSGNALLDLFWQPRGTADLIPLTTINFGIDATANSRGTPVPDTFRSSFIQPEPVRLGDQWVRFTVTGLPDLFQLAENSTVDLGGLTVAFIPEPQTNAMLLGLATLCFVLTVSKSARSRISM